jgi:hypothetical protein
VGTRKKVFRARVGCEQLLFRNPSGQLRVECMSRSERDMVNGFKFALALEKLVLPYNDDVRQDQQDLQL